MFNNFFFLKIVSFMR